jgi:hypothetical protein
MKKKNQVIQNNSFTEFMIYSSPNGKVKFEVFLRDENIWLTQAKIAELFGIERSVVTKHLSNIYKENELDKDSTCAKIAQVQLEGTRNVNRTKITYPISINNGNCLRKPEQSTGIR